MSTQAGVQVALQHIQNAEKSLKTSLFKWFADPDVAASEYTKAATVYRGLKLYDKSRDCYLKAADCYKKAKSLFHAARSVENAVLMCRELGEFRKIPDLGERAWRLYQENGTFDAAIASLEKTISFIEDKDSINAVYFLKHAAELSDIQSDQTRSSKFAHRAANLLVKETLYDQAVTKLIDSITYSQMSGYTGTVGRTVLELALCYMAIEDIVAAEKALVEYSSYCDPDDLKLFSDIVEAFNRLDRKAVLQLLTHPFIQNLDPEYVRLAKLIPLPPNPPSTDVPSASTNDTIESIDDLC